MRLIIPVLTRVLSALASLALIGVGSLLVVEVVAAALDADPVLLPSDYADRVAGLAWDDRSVVTALAATAGVGVVALLVGMWRRAPLTIPVEGRSGVAIERRGLEGSLSRRLTGLDGVSGARVRAGRRRLRVRIDSRRRVAPEGAHEAVREVLDLELADQRLDLRPSVRLRYRGGEL